MNSYVFNVAKSLVFSGDFPFDETTYNVYMLLVTSEMFDEIVVPVYDTTLYIKKFHTINPTDITVDYKIDGYEIKEVTGLSKIETFTNDNLLITTFTAENIIYDTTTGLEAGGAVIYADVVGTEIPLIALNFGSKRLVDSGQFIVDLANGFLRLEA